MEIVNLRTESTNDGRTAVLADIPGAGRVFFGYLAIREIDLQIGGSVRVASPLVQCEIDLQIGGSDRVASPLVQ